MGLGDQNRRPRGQAGVPELSRHAGGARPQGGIGPEPERCPEGREDWQKEEDVLVLIEEKLQIGYFQNQDPPHPPLCCESLLPVKKKKSGCCLLGFPVYGSTAQMEGPQRKPGAPEPAGPCCAWAGEGTLSREEQSSVSDLQTL